MKICVIGTGYVGLVTGACLANLGNDVICVDKDHKKISELKKGRVPFYEPGLDDLLSLNFADKRLSFTSDLPRSVKHSEVIFIAVGTPPKEDGSADLSALRAVAEEIASALKNTGSKGHKIIAVKSTVPVGTGEMIEKIMNKRKIPQKNISVVSNPEFLREGTSIFNFMHPNRIVIGASNNRAFNMITELYRPLNAHIVFTDTRTAELVKYVSNCFLAAKISFINEIANVCDRLGVDVSDIAYAVGLDKRIGRDFFSAGIGYGGSCLPKDVSALIHLSEMNDFEPLLLKAVQAVNENQTDYILSKVKKLLGDVAGKKIAMLGVTFKPETDDLRDAPSIRIIKKLKEKGARLTAYDPILKGKEIHSVKVQNNVYSAVRGCEAVIISTEWSEFRQIDFYKMKKLMKKPVIFDGRNIYDRKRMKAMGFIYEGVGR